MALSSLDRRILATLIADGRRTFRDLAGEVGLGASATAERVRRLVQQGIVRRFTAEIDLTALGLGLEAVVDVHLRPDATAPHFEEGLRAIPAVLDAVHLTGSSDYLLLVACRDPADLDATLYRLKDAGAGRTESRLVLRRIPGLGVQRLVAGG